MSVQPVGAGFHAAWVLALEALDVEVAAAEALLSGEHATQQFPTPDPWRPPVGLGPLPLDLRPRADATLTRQLATAHALGQAMLGNRQHAALGDRIEAGGDGGRPAYVDCLS
ncbi:MAG: hypothetical protein DLM59_19450 [Pseudonocardiales bacterium]|nr:MAG: hypothetical protein DLM59_19450 [Pseudonocardiales bacterium]